LSDAFFFLRRLQRQRLHVFAAAVDLSHLVRTLIFLFVFSISIEF
jgi:hypothetical protein